MTTKFFEDLVPLTDLKVNPVQGSGSSAPPPRLDWRDRVEESA